MHLREIDLPKLYTKESDLMIKDLCLKIYFRQQSLQHNKTNKNLDLKDEIWKISDLYLKESGPKTK